MDLQQHLATGLALAGFARVLGTGAVRSPDGSVADDTG